MNLRPNLPGCFHHQSRCSPLPKLSGHPEIEQIPWEQIKYWVLIENIWRQIPFLGLQLPDLQQSSFSVDKKYRSSKNVVWSRRQKCIYILAQSDNKTKKKTTKKEAHLTFFWGNSAIISNPPARAFNQCPCRRNLTKLPCPLSRWQASGDNRYPRRSPAVFIARRRAGGLTSDETGGWHKQQPDNLFYLCGILHRFYSR